jgi:hypothetical protein
VTNVSAHPRTTIHRPGTSVLLVAVLTIAIVLAALTIPRLLSTPTVTQPAHTVADTGGVGAGVGVKSQHAVHGNGRGYAATMVASKRQDLQVLLDGQTRLFEEGTGTPGDVAQASALAVQVAAARKSLADAVRVLAAFQIRTGAPSAVTGSP